jgi:hypothetical protein
MNIPATMPLVKITGGASFNQRISRLREVTEPESQWL